jgi:hypothetical protein
MNITKSGNCPQDKVVCPGGECAANHFMCATVPTCPKNAITCPDLSCALRL